MAKSNDPLVGGRLALRFMHRFFLSGFFFRKYKEFCDCSKSIGNTVIGNF